MAKTRTLTLMVMRTMNMDDHGDAADGDAELVCNRALDSYMISATDRVRQQRHQTGF